MSDFRAGAAFRAGQPLFLDAWPASWSACAPPTAFVALDRMQANALGAQIAGYGHWFERTSPQPLRDVAAALDAHVAQCGHSAFVRLTSRSAKDSPHATRRGMRVTSGAAALAMFMSGSRRVASDLRFALMRNVEIAIAVRPWIAFERRDEYRCFMVNGEWAGASQAWHLEGERIALTQTQLRRVAVVLRRIMSTLVAAAHVRDAAFDIVLPERAGNAARAVLLDANPLVDATDYALFGEKSRLDGTLRFRTAAGDVRELALPSDDAAWCVA